MWDLLAQHGTNAQIARHLGIAESRAKRRVRVICQALGHRRVQAGKHCQFLIPGVNRKNRGSIRSVMIRKGHADPGEEDKEFSSGSQRSIPRHHHCGKISSLFWLGRGFPRDQKVSKVHLVVRPLYSGIRKKVNRS